MHHLHRQPAFFPSGFVMSQKEHVFPARLVFREETVDIGSGLLGSVGPLLFSWIRLPEDAQFEV